MDRGMVEEGLIGHVREEGYRGEGDEKVGEREHDI